MNAETVLMVLRLLDLVASAAIRSVEVRGRFNQLRDEVAVMVAESRGPTEEEWSSLNERADALHRELQGEG